MALNIACIASVSIKGFLYVQRSFPFFGFLKVGASNPRKVIGNSWGEGGLNSQTLEEKYEHKLNWNFLGVERVQNKNLPWRSIPANSHALCVCHTPADRKLRSNALRAISHTFTIPDYLLINH